MFKQPYGSPEELTPVRESSWRFVNSFEIRSRSTSASLMSDLRTQLPGPYIILNDPRRALTLALRTLELARSTGDVLATTHALLIIGKCQLELAGYAVAIQTLLEARQHLEHHTDSPLRVNIENSLGNCYLGLGELDHALESYISGIGLAEHLGLTDRLPTITMNLAVCYVQLGDFQQALVHLLAILSMRESAGRAPSSAYTRLNIGYLYSTIRDFKRSLFHRKAAMAMLQNESNVSEHLTGLSSLGFSYLDNGLHWDAQPLFQEELRTARLLGMKRHEAMALQGLGNVAMELGDLEEASIRLEQALELHNELHYLLGKIHCNALLATVRARLGNPLPSLDHMKAAIDLGERHKLHGVIGPMYKQYGTALERFDDLKGVIEAFKKYFQYEEQYERFRTASQATDLQERFERDRLHADPMPAESPSQAPASTEDGALRSLSLALLNQRQILRKAKRDLLAEGAHERKLRVTMKAINSVLDADVEWNQVEQQLAPDHLEFSRRLLALHPDITRTELRVCHLIRLGWSTKSIAQLLAASPLTINKHRAHLRSKLKLSRDMSLQAHLLEL